jgi:hypothetical protein
MRESRENTPDYASCSSVSGYTPARPPRTQKYLVSDNYNVNLEV